MIDTHCHLNIDPLCERLPTALKKAREAGVTDIMTIGTSIETSKKCLSIAKRYKHVFAAVGIHPDDASEIEKQSSRTEFEKLLEDPKVKAVGEIGLDYHRINPEDGRIKQLQKEAFAYQMHVARRHELPIIVHSRDSAKDTFAMIADSRPPKVVLHCYCYDWHMARMFLELDPTYMISLTGIVTFPNAPETQEVARRIPLDRLMVETDAPFLAPQQYRGKTNQPAYIPEITSKIAQLKQLAFKTVEQETTKNAKRFFYI